MHQSHCLIQLKFIVRSSSLFGTFIYIVLRLIVFFCSNSSTNKADGRTLNIVETTVSLRINNKEKKDDDTTMTHCCIPDINRSELR